jgi:hypothetical protein
MPRSARSSPAVAPASQASSDPDPGPSGPLKLADVARLAGVSLATASRALNDVPGVSPVTRRRVLEIADRNAYVLSPEASNLARGSTGRVAVVVPHLSRWFFGTMVEALESVFRAADLDVLLYAVGDVRDRRDFFERLPARRKVDAVGGRAGPAGGRAHALPRVSSGSPWRSWGCASSWIQAPFMHP